MFDLRGYKPEKVKENDFSPIKGKNFTCKVNSSKIEDVEAGTSEDSSRKWNAYKRLKYELEIMDDDGKGFIGRKIWKSYNLDSLEATGKVPKTPIQKLADVFFTVGLEFNDMDTLHIANDKFAEFHLDVSFSSFKGSAGNDVQMHYVNGKVEEGLGETTQFDSSF